ncbi:hypothetical protein U1Q18_033208, partial [Sarracenia purpurea var. burkii]
PLGVSCGVVEVEVRVPPSSRLLTSEPAIEAIEAAGLTTSFSILSLICPLLGGRYDFGLVLGLEIVISISENWG